MLQEVERLEPQRVEDEAVGHLRQAIAQGRHWYLALLEAIGLWTRERETVDGHDIVYLIENEALDWPALVARLSGAVNGAIPEHERDMLLFHDQPPLELTKSEFSSLIGSLKYRAYLNYFYGLAVEEALLDAVEGEVRKEQRCQAYCREKLVRDEAYRRIYGATEAEMFGKFSLAKGKPQGDSMTLAEAKQFTYWCFKYRLTECEPAKVASDTRKGLDELARRRETSGRRVSA